MLQGVQSFADLGFQEATMRAICVAVVGVVVVAVPITAQPDEARAFLDHVPEADVAAATGDTPLWAGRAQRRVCLATSIYILAARRTDDSELRAAAAVLPASARDPWDSTTMREENLVAIILGADTPQQAWDSFRVEEPSCFRITALGMAVKVYRVSTFIPW